jgi:ATP-binding cassette, subfamily B, bacterial
MNFKSFPFYSQYDAMDCGPACLRMIAKYYGQTYPLQYFRDLCHVSREGSSLQGLRDAAATIGMPAKCVLLSPGYLYSEARIPCVIHWDNKHFVVVYKISRDYIYIADPAFGKIKYKKADFPAHWIAAGDQGYALLLQPAEDFYVRREAGVADRRTFSLTSYLRSYRQLFIQLILAMLFGSFIQLILPFLTQLIVDKGINNKNISLLQLVLLGQFLLIISRGSVNFLRGWILFYLSTPINIELVHNFLIKLTKLPLKFFDIKMIGDALQRISDHQRIESFITATVLSIFLTIANIIVFGVVLAAYSGRLFLIFLAGTVLYLLWIQMFLAKRREQDFFRSRQTVRNNNAIIQLIMGMQEIRLNNYEQQKIADWAEIQHELFSVNKKSLGLTQKQQAGCFLLQESQNIIITYFAACLVINGDITLGMMLAVQFILGQLNGPVEQMVHLVASAQDAKISFERIEDIYAMENEESPDENKIGEIPPEARIILSNVSFQYNGPYSERVLKEVSFVIPNKKITAIVGASGSGKTTLIKLLLGVYRPVSGEILIGDVSLEKISHRTWREKCGMVMQDGFIFADTIANNIALQAEAADEQLKLAAKMANIAEFIESLPQGYKTLIGANGHGLSQGQKQRILIARAVYKNPEYIFFDEATNSLDANNERIIMENLERFFHNKTVIAVAHRLSTVKNADHIIVLDKGAVVETGSHNALIAQRGAYYNLVKNQLELGG